MNTRWTFEQVRDKIWRLLRDSLEAYDDIAAYHAPSECNGLVRAYYRKALQRIEYLSGWTVEEVLKEAERRTTAKWMYFSGFEHVANL